MLEVWDGAPPVRQAFSLMIASSLKRCRGTPSMAYSMAFRKKSLGALGPSRTPKLGWTVRTSAKASSPM